MAVNPSKPGRILKIPPYKVGPYIPWIGIDPWGPYEWDGRVLTLQSEAIPILWTLESHAKASPYFAVWGTYEYQPPNAFGTPGTILKPPKACVFDMDNYDNSGNANYTIGDAIYDLAVAKDVYLGSEFVIDRNQMNTTSEANNPYVSLAPTYAKNGRWASPYGGTMPFLYKYLYVDPSWYIGGELLCIVYFDPYPYVVKRGSPTTNAATFIDGAVTEMVAGLVGMIARFGRIKIKVYPTRITDEGDVFDPSALKAAAASACTAFFRAAVVGIPEIEIVDGVLVYDDWDGNGVRIQAQSVIDFNEFFGT